jgi:hypothetical protein
LAAQGKDHERLGADRVLLVTISQVVNDRNLFTWVTCLGWRVLSVALQRSRLLRLASKLGKAAV